MGLVASPAIWQSYIHTIQSCMPDGSKCLAVVEELLFHISKHSQLKYLKDLLKAVLKNGFKILPKEVNFSDLNCRTLATLFKEKKVCIKPFKTRLQALQKLKLTKIAKDLNHCRSS